MTLTGRPFLALLVVLFLGSAVLLVVFWGALAPRRVLPVIGRVVALLIVNALLMVTVAVALNDQYLFYVDWHDLFSGSTPSAVTVGKAGAAPSTVFDPTASSGGSHATAAPGPFPFPEHPLASLPALPAGSGPGNPVLTFQVTGAKSRLQGEVMVLLPQSYFSPGMATHRYPVIVAPPTYPGTPEALFRNFDLQNGVADAVGRKAIADSIVVVPQTQFPGAPDSECVNYPSGQPQAETWMSSDIPSWVVSHFRAVSDRASWATLGVSAGAWCASMLSFLHPGTFSAAVSLSGYFRPTFDSSPPYPNGSPQLEAYNLERLAGTAPPPVAMLVQASAQDKVSYPSTSRLLASARRPLAIDWRISATGGHRWVVWRPLLPVSLEWLGRTVPGFRP